MHFSLLLRYPERSPSELSAEEVQIGLNSFDKFAKELAHDGALVSAEMFERSSETTTLQIFGETMEVNEGPAEAAQYPIGGIVVIDVPDYAEALRWAKRAPSIAWGPVELRGSMVRFVDGEWRPEEASEPSTLRDGDPRRHPVTAPVGSSLVEE